MIVEDPKSMLKAKINLEDRYLDNMLLEYLKNTNFCTHKEFYTTDRSIFPTELGYKDLYGNVIFGIIAKWEESSEGFYISIEKIENYDKVADV